MANNILKKLFTLIMLISSLIACQSTPPVAPVPDVEQQPATEVTEQKDTTQQAEDPQKLLHQQAIQSAKKGDLDVAIQQFNQVIAQNPTAKHAYSNLGLLYLHKNNIKSAKEAFLTAIEQDKTDSIAYNHLAIIERQQGEFKKALFHYYKAINADPDYANAHLNLGILLDIYMQEFPKALEQYEIFQQLTDGSNKQVEKWILDIKRRIESSKSK